MNNFEKVSAAISSDPDLLNRIFNKEAPTRSLPWGNEADENAELRGILGSDVSEEDIQEVLKELGDNQIVQLYRQSEGAIDAKELMDFAGDLSATKAADQPAVRALFDGKLQLKEIILIILLLKLFKKKQQTANTGYTSNNLLNSLLGTQQQPSVTNNLFSSLFGNGLGTTSNYGYYTQPSSNNSLLNLFGLGSGNSYNYNNSYGLLNSFLGGNSLQQPQSQSLFNLLTNQSSNAVYSNGQVGVNSLFSILNTLLGGR